jgi:hypothetical protein
MWRFKHSYPEKKDLDIHERWSVSEGKHGTNLMIVRVNRGVAAAVGHPAYTHQVGVAVPLRAPDPTGFPGPEKSGDLGEIEDLLAASLCAERLCLHVATISTGGMRELVFYSSDPAATHSLLEQLAKQITTHAIQHIVQPDPKWHVYRQFD